MFDWALKHIAIKITLGLMLVLVPAMGLFSWGLVENRSRVLEEGIFAKARTNALVGAEVAEHFLAELIVSGQFAEVEIFDTDYRPIVEGELAGAEIPKYHTDYDRYLDGTIQHMQDAFLSDPMVVYAVLVDRNGYLPTHNSRYSKRLTGDAELDRVGNRTKRIFDDPVGLAAARFEGGGGETVLRQVYHRDTGVTMWDVSAPVTVLGRHWGAFRIGLSMEQAEREIVLLRRTVFWSTALTVLTCALLIGLTVTKATRPLADLTRAARGIALGRRGERIAIRSRDEVGTLVEAFNTMSETLQQTTVSRDFYDMLLSSMHDLLMVISLGGEIVSVNRAACQILHYEEQELLGMSLQQLLGGTRKGEEWFEALVSEGRSYAEDMEFYSQAGDAIPMSVSASPVHDEQTALNGFILVSQDNSRRIEAEQSMERAFDQAFKLNEELREVNGEMEGKNRELEEAYAKLKASQVQILQQEKMASIGQLAAGVAHEINNPIGFVSSNLRTLGKYIERLDRFVEQQGQLLQAEAGANALAELQQQRKKLKIDYLLEDSRDLLEESLEGSERVRTIVQNLKSFSRLDQAEEELVDLNDCLESTISIAWNELKYKATLEKDFGELDMLRCHPQQLNQVFMNLLVNAAQALEREGEIRVRTWQEGELLSVSVQDTGCGIPPQNLSRIFEPFFTTKEVGKGTGLGMSISYEIVKKHDGEILVESEVGKGSTFTVHLPLQGAGTDQARGKA